MNRSIKSGKSGSSLYLRGQLAKAANVGIETVRFYEQQGLLPKPVRSSAGYRQYTHDSLKRLLFVQHAKELGFSLGEIKDLLSLRVNSNCSCKNVKVLAEEKVRDIQSKIRGLIKMQAVLKRLIHACSGKGPTSECPILEALDS